MRRDHRQLSELAEHLQRVHQHVLRGPDLGTGWGLFTEGPVLRGNWKKVSEHFGINHKSFGSFLKVSGSFHEYSMKIKTCVFAVFDFHGIFMEVSGRFREASGRLKVSSEAFGDFLPASTHFLPASRHKTVPFGGG